MVTITMVQVLNQPKNAFTGETFSRGEVYKEIIKSNSKSELQAYALYRAVMCYSPSSINVCGGKDATKSTRKQWYTQIKRDYPKYHMGKIFKILLVAYSCLNSFSRVY